MHTFGLVFFSLVATFWILHGLRIANGARKLPWLRDFGPARDENCPSISLLFAARDEEEKLPAALATLAELDYPKLEIIAVDDRSQDATGRILDEFAAAHPRFRAVHVGELPSGWLGKPHALQKAYEVSNGEWFLFTDADVRFRRDALRRAVTLASERNLDHLTLFGDVEMHGFWEKTLITFFGFAFQLATDPHRVGDPHSRAYVGVGAFQLLKRSAYEASGTHRRLAMEVVDDMKLGKLVKQAGFRSGIGIAQEAVSVRWHAGLGNLIRGVTKNFFAAANFSLVNVAAALVGLLLTNLAPLGGIFLGHGWIRLVAAISVVVALGMACGVDLVMGVSPLYALTYPLGALLLCYMLLRSTAVTLSQGGITWRGTFYPLEELKRGIV
ncbi:MAG TPA: glycosyltransferase [Candidatus Solibacter sp.]|nr:glycosyltransferase [Candidatus Solibacter sp.]